MVELGLAYPSSVVILELGIPNKAVDDHFHVALKFLYTEKESNYQPIVKIWKKSLKVEIHIFPRTAGGRFRSIRAPFPIHENPFQSIPTHSNPFQS